MKVKKPEIPEKIIYEFDDARICTILPRTVPFQNRIFKMGHFFCAFGLEEAEKILKMSDEELPYRLYILLDIANGTMLKEVIIGKRLKKRFGSRLVLMGGNIGNPFTYLFYNSAEFDFVRLGIGDGNGCLTSKQLGVSYPYASLIANVTKIRKFIPFSHCKIIADGGMNNYSDIIKCLALGADYIMCGKLFAQAALNGENIGDEFTYRGMSTKSAQKDMGNLKLKTAEGRTLKLKKEYTLSGWIDNFVSYLRSAMSYCDSRNLKEFRKKAKCQIISPNASFKINNK